jgi:hypothetical protein
MHRNHARAVPYAWNAVEELSGETAFEIAIAAERALPDLEAWVIGTSDSQAALIGLVDKRLYCMRRVERDGIRGLETLSTLADEAAVSVFDTFEGTRQRHPQIPDLFDTRHTRVWTFSGPGWSVDATSDVDGNTRAETTCRRIAEAVGYLCPEPGEPPARR